MPAGKSPKLLLGAQPPSHAPRESGAGAADN
jgi:hypothetical protein